LVQLGELPVHLLQRLADRRDQAVDRGRACVQLDPCHLLGLLQLRLRHLQEGLRVGLERVQRQRLEALGQLFLGGLDEAQLLVHRPLLLGTGSPLRSELGECFRPAVLEHLGLGGGGERRAE